MLKNHKSFFSKVLLAGEYTVISDGEALAIPFPQFKGQFEFRPASNQDSLIQLINYLQENGMEQYFNLQEMHEDIQKGLFYNADIPIGYGLGSSGALIAALYDRYAISKANDLHDLKSILAQTECAFHGSSSGMDPLVSYLNRPLYFSSNEIQILPENALDLQRFFLVDTGIARSTAHHVQYYLEHISAEEANKSDLHALKNANHLMIRDLINNHPENLNQTIKTISTIQYRLFQAMIPEDFKSLWLEGLNTDRFYLKLCGAGGGGMILGYAQHSNFSNHHPVFQL
ncbi:MAG: hypothetical protein LC107_12260 [Chitinophagales bacterium]|nr:hypothetical protein [Chitinophagales bacterium]